MLIYILVIIVFSSSNTKIQERKEKNKKTRSSTLSPHSRISVDPCTSRIRNIYLQKTKTKQTNKKRTWRWMGWGSESQEEGEPAPGTGMGSGPHRVKVSLSPLCFPWGGYHTGKARNVSPLPWCLGRGAAPSLQPNPEVDSYFVVSTITPSRSHTYACTHTLTGTHTHAPVIVVQCNDDSAGALASVKWTKEIGPLGRECIALSCPFSDLHCNMPSRAFKCFQLH